MKALFDACKELGYTCGLHDQYRDYYTDAPSYSPEFAVHEEDSPARRTDTFRVRASIPTTWKDGYIPFMNHWDGGTQTYLSNRYMLGHIREELPAYLWSTASGRSGSNNDVFGYIPPDQDFNPEHPCTRTESMQYRAAVFNWVRANVGIVGTEAGADWTIPYIDYVPPAAIIRNPNSGNDATSKDAIPVPLYDLVYHDAVVTTGGSDLRSWLLATPGQPGDGAERRSRPYR